MKKYILLIGLVLLSLSVQAKDKGLTATLNTNKKQEVNISKENMQMRKKMHAEHMKKRFEKRYSSLSKEELEKHKKRLEHSIKSTKKDSKERFQAELDVVNSLLNK